MDKNVTPKENVTENKTSKRSQRKKKYIFDLKKKNRKKIIMNHIFHS